MTYITTIKKQKNWNNSIIINLRLFDEEVYTLKVDDERIINMTNENLRPSVNGHFK